MADITASASPHAVQLVSAGLIHALTPVVTGQKHSGLLELDWDIALHLTVTPGKSSVTLNDPAAGKPGTIGVTAVDVHWDKLAFSLGVNLPTITIGGFCIIPNPWGGCLKAVTRDQPKITGVFPSVLAPNTLVTVIGSGLTTDPGAATQPAGAIAPQITIDGQRVLDVRPDPQIADRLTGTVPAGLVAADAQTPVAGKLQVLSAYSVATPSVNVQLTRWEH
jgi:hypothetical protein